MIDCYNQVHYENASYQTQSEYFSKLLVLFGINTYLPSLVQVESRGSDRALNYYNGLR